MPLRPFMVPTRLLAGCVDINNEYNLVLVSGVVLELNLKCDYPSEQNLLLVASGWLSEPRC